MYVLTVGLYFYAGQSLAQIRHLIRVNTTSGMSLWLTSVVLALGDRGIFPYHCTTQTHISHKHLLSCLNEIFDQIHSRRGVRGIAIGSDFSGKFSGYGCTAHYDVYRLP